MTALRINKRMLTTSFALILLGTLQQCTVGNAIGGYQLSDGGSTGRVSRVNGGIRIGTDTTTGRLGTVNGSIRVAANSLVGGTISSVNGGIHLSENVNVQGKVSTVNGRITSSAGTTIIGGLGNVNGAISLNNTRVEGNLSTSNGDISLTNSTIIEGDITVRDPQGWWNRGLGNSRYRSELYIDSNTVVIGDIHLHEEVELTIEEGADIGGEIIRH